VVFVSGIIDGQYRYAVYHWHNWLLLVVKINGYIQVVRQYDDALFSDYQAMLDGRKELALNPHRAEKFFRNEFVKHAKGYQQQVTIADIYNGFAGNLVNIAILALIGINYYLAAGLGWASTESAGTFALAILFLRSPLMSAVAAIPALLSANVSMHKLSQLNLHPMPSVSPPHQPEQVFQKLQLQQVTFSHCADGHDPEFVVGPLNLTVERGQMIFVIGGNGSGKSTFAHLLTGLYQPHQGQILLNGEDVTAANKKNYGLLFSAVFTDFHLFHQLLDGQGELIDPQTVDYWLNVFALQDKVSHHDGRLSRVSYSQGQRKRLALLMAIMEQRDCLLLDEWAADQDPHFRSVFYHDILPLLKNRGKTIIAITHDDKYFGIADRIIRMDEGQLTELDNRNLSVIKAEA